MFDNLLKRELENPSKLLGKDPNSSIPSYEVIVGENGIQLEFMDTCYHGNSAQRTLNDISEDEMNRVCDIVCDSFKGDTLENGYYLVIGNEIYERRGFVTND